MGPGGIILGNYDPTTLTQDQRNWLYNQFGHSGNAPVGYGGENAPGEMSNYRVGMTAAQAQQQNAQDLFNQQQGSAISTLQTGKANLSQQYADLLKTVTGEYTPIINEQTANVNSQLASRGLTPDSALSKNTVGSFLAPIYGQEAANAQTIGAGSIADINSYNNAIAQLQSGQAASNLNIPLQYGSLSMNQTALPYQLALTQAQAQSAPYVATSIPGVLFNAGNNTTTNVMQQALAQMGYKLQL